MDIVDYALLALPVGITVFLTVFTGRPSTLYLRAWLPGVPTDW